MWQYIITGAILLVAAVFVIHRIMKTLRGKDTFSCAFCTKETCPAKEVEKKLTDDRKTNDQTPDYQQQHAQTGEENDPPEEKDNSAKRSN